MILHDRSDRVVRAFINDVTQAGGGESCFGYTDYEGLSKASI